MVWRPQTYPDPTHSARILAARFDHAPLKITGMVTWLSDANVKVEYGDNGRKGYSTAFAFPDY